MCQEPTELLWIGCLTGWILILKVRFDTFDTKHQLADNLTKGNFTRYEWNHLLCLFNISHFSSTSCAKNSSLISCTDKMAKRVQEQKGEDRSVAKSKSTAMNLSSHVPASSSTAKIPIASETTVKPESRTRRNSKSDAASGSQVKLQDAYLGGLMDKATEILVATKEDSGDLDLSEPETWSFHEEEVTGSVAYKTGTGKPGASSISENQGSPKAERKEWPHSLHMHPAAVLHMVTVLSIVRKYTNESPRTQWRIWTWTRPFGAHSWITLFKQLFILVRTMRWSLEVSGTVIQWNWKTDPWSNRNHWFENDWFQRTSVEIDKLIVQQSLSDHQRQNPHLLRFSALYMIRLHLGTVFWEEALQGTESHRRYADGVRLENVPRIHDVGHPRRDSKFSWKIYSVNLSSSTTGSSSCQCTTTLYGEIKGNTEQCEYNSKTIADYARRFPRGRWSFLGPGSDKTRLVLVNQTNPGTEWHKRWCWISQSQVTQHFVPPVPSREVN